MGTVIRASAVSLESNNIFDTILASEPSSIDYSVRAAEECIRRAGIDRTDIDLVVNIGTYRDKNIEEPAIASLIQKRLGISLDPLKDPSGKSSFSFDLRDGVVGMLSAVKVIDSLLQQKMVNLVLIVSSDVHPSKRHVPQFPYTHLGAAMLLSWSDDEDKGFQKVMFSTSEGDYHGVDGSFELFIPDALNHIRIDVQEDYGQRAGDFTIKAFKEYVQSGELNPAEVKLAIIAEPVPGFSDRVAEAVGLEGKAPLGIYENHGNVLSSALLLGHHMAVEQQLFEEGDKILFVGTSSGLTFSCGLYQA